MSIRQGRNRRQHRSSVHCCPRPLKTAFQQGGRREHTAGVPLRYVEDMFEPRTPLEAVFSGRLEVPGETRHDKSRIPRHEVRVRNAGRFITQAGIEEERGLLPFRIEEILHEEERLEPPV